MSQLKLQVVNKVVDQWQPGLKACIRAQGRHFLLLTAA